ncbi:hypothetical protein [Ornithinibacillus californiensis]|uniref:hypothetical protein n=1 Tax=Ornithinibacillus californiensis TaxID=161536 RepID=UPI00064DDE48|nr:hypothetical protein [Ornithinibacillus californiensis]
MGDVLYLLFTNGAMQKAELVQKLMITSGEFYPLVSKLKSEKLIVEVAPDLFSLSSTGRQAIQQKREEKESKLEHEKFLLEERQKLLKRSAIEENIYLNQKINQLEGQVVSLEKEIKYLLHKNKQLTKSLESEKDLRLKKEIRLREVVRYHHQRESRRNSPFTNNPLDPLIDKAIMEHEDQIISGKEDYDPTHDPNSPFYMDDIERYFQRVRDGEE